MTKRKVLLAYHHNDKEYKTDFVAKYHEQFDFVFSNQMEDINDGLFSDKALVQKTKDENTKDVEGMIILFGSETWKRKQIDWEIASILSEHKALVGIIISPNNNFGFTKKLTDPKTIPVRFIANMKSDYAKIYNWNIISMNPQQWFETALEDCKKNKVSNDLALLRRNY